MINKKKEENKLEDNLYYPNFRIKKEFNLNDLTNLIEDEIFLSVKENNEFMLKHGGDLDCFTSTFDFVIALCINPDLSLQYLKTASPEIICFTVMMLQDLFFTEKFPKRRTIDELNEYIKNNAKLFKEPDYNYVIDIMSDYVLVDDESVFDRGYLATYVDIDKCLECILNNKS